MVNPVELLGPIGAIALLVLAAWFPIRLFACIFSKRTRAAVRRRWLLHVGWGLLSIGFVGFTIIGGYDDQRYVVRAKVLEGIELAAAARTGVAEHWRAHRRFPGDNAEAGVVPPRELSGAYVESVTVVPGGRIVVRYGASRGLPPQARGRTIEIVAIAAGEAVRWDCTGGDMPARYRPTECGR